MKPILSADFNSRGQVDLVDIQSVPDNEYKWIMHYQDHFTKFSVLRPLKSKRAEKLMRTTKRKLSELSVGNNVIIPIPQYDRGPTYPRNILGVIEEVYEYGYRVGTSVGTLSWYICRNQIEAVNDTSLSISMIPSLQISLREAVRKISKTGGQGYLSCKTSKCKCKKKYPV